MISPVATPSVTIVAPRRRRNGDAAVIAGVCLVGALLIAVHILVLHQGIGWASPLLFGDWLFTVAFALATLLYSLDLGRLVFRPWLALDDDALLNRLTVLGLGFGALFTAILCLGFVRLLYGPVMLTMWLLYTALRRRPLAACILRIAHAVATWTRAGLPTAKALSTRVVLIVVTVSLLHLALRAMLPLSDWDAVTYHLAAPKIYLAQHMIVPLPDLPLAMAPSGEEMALMAGLAAGTDGLGKVLMVAFCLLTGLAVYALARRLAGAAAGWIAALAVFTMEWLVLVMPLTLTDGVGAFFLVTGAADLCAWAEKPEQTRRLARAGLLIGFAGACKETNLPAIAALVGTVGLVSLCRHGLTIGPRLITSIRACLWSGASAMIAVGPWLLKSRYFFGNVFYPTTLAVNNPNPQAGAAAVASPTESHARWMADTLGNFMVGHVGVLTIALLLLPLLWGKPGPRTVAIFLAVCLFLWLQYVPVFEPPRYYLGLAGISLALAVPCLYTLADRVRLPMTVMDLTLSMVVLIQALPVLTVGLNELRDPGLLQVARGGISRYDWLVAHVRPYRAEQWANDHLPPGGPIALVNLLPGYYMNRPYLADWYGSRLARLEGNAATRDGELNLWCREGVRYALFDRGDGSPDFNATNLLRPLSAFRWIEAPGLAPRTLFSANGVDVLDVSPCAAKRRSGQG